MTKTLTQAEKRRRAMLRRAGKNSKGAAELRKIEAADKAPAERLIKETRAALVPKAPRPKVVEPKANPIVTAERARVKAILAAAGDRQAEQGRFLAYSTDLSTDIAIGVIRASERHAPAAH